MRAVAACAEKRRVLLEGARSHDLGDEDDLLGLRKVKVGEEGEDVLGKRGTAKKSASNQPDGGERGVAKMEKRRGSRAMGGDGRSSNR